LGARKDRNIPRKRKRPNDICAQQEETSWEAEKKQSTDFYQLLARLLYFQSTSFFQCVWENNILKAFSYLKPTMQVK